MGRWRTPARRRSLTRWRGPGGGRPGVTGMFVAFPDEGTDLGRLGLVFVVVVVAVSLSRCAGG